MIRIHGLIVNKYCLMGPYAVHIMHISKKLPGFGLNLLLKSVQNLFYYDLWSPWAVVAYSLFEFTNVPSKLWILKRVVQRKFDSQTSPCGTYSRFAEQVQQLKSLLPSQQRQSVRPVKISN